MNSTTKPRSSHTTITTTYDTSGNCLIIRNGSIGITPKRALQTAGSSHHIISCGKRWVFRKLKFKFYVVTLNIATLSHRNTECQRIIVSDIGGCHFSKGKRVRWCLIVYVTIPAPDGGSWSVSGRSNLWVVVISIKRSTVTFYRSKTIS